MAENSNKSTENKNEDFNSISNYRVRDDTNYMREKSFGCWQATSFVTGVCILMGFMIGPAASSIYYTRK